MISGRIPPQVEKAIKKQMHSYASNITSVLSQFPSQQVSTHTVKHAYSEHAYNALTLIGK